MIFTKSVYFIFKMFDKNLQNEVRNRGQCIVP